MAALGWRPEVANVIAIANAIDNYSYLQFNPKKRLRAARDTSVRGHIERRFYEIAVAPTMRRYLERATSPIAPHMRAWRYIPSPELRHTVIDDDANECHVPVRDDEVVTVLDFGDGASSRPVPC